MTDATIKWFIESAKKQGLSFMLICFIAWYTHFNFKEYKVQTNERINQLEKSILECNQYNRSVTQNAIKENTKQLVLNNQSLKDNNDLITLLKDRL